MKRVLSAILIASMLLGMMSGLTSCNVGDLFQTTPETDTLNNTSSEATQNTPVQTTTPPADTEAPVHEHSYAAGDIIKKPTCITEGEGALVCACGDTISQTLPATGEHTYQNGKCVVCNYRTIPLYAIPSAYDADGDGKSDYYNFSPELAEAYQDGIHVWAGDYDTFLSSEKVNTTETSGIAHWYVSDSANVFQHIVYRVTVPQTGLYEMVIHLRLKDGYERGTKYTINEGTEHEQVFQTSHAFSGDTYTKVRDEETHGTYMYGISVNLVEGENTVRIEKTETSPKCQHYRDFYFVKVDESQTEENPEESKHVLDGKKILFIGNSFTYYGKTVIEKKQSILTQEPRSNDTGYFYQLCKSNGAEVSVTNWTFGGHSLADILGVCSANRGCDGVKHLDYLVDREFDYVFIQHGGTDSHTFEELQQQCDMLMNIFREANPDVKFIFHIPHNPYEKNFDWLSNLEALSQKGMLIVEWGELVSDLISGGATVPGGTQIYNRNSFIVCKSATDGYHPNVLTGYITTLMLYCAITGESAVGQDYSFCGDTSININFSFADFIKTYYTYDNATTNLVEIFSSPEDMLGIQQLIDEYLAKQTQ